MGWRSIPFYFRNVLLHLLPIVLISACERNGSAGTHPRPVVAYSCNETTGTTVADASGGGNTGTLVNATWSPAGHSGGALSFNGTTARVMVPDMAALHFVQDMTMEAWVNPSATVTDDWQAVIYKGHDAYLLGTNAKTGLPIGGGIMGTTAVLASGVAVLPLNTWTHLATTYDGAAVRLYVNGTEVSSRPATGPLRESTTPLEIGGSMADGGTFAGLIDDIRLYATALTSAQIQTDMNTPVAGR
jgi:hypothetical protein